jgi:hypothetical protein
MTTVRSGVPGHDDGTAFIRLRRTTRPADADVCRFLAALHANCGPILRTNHGQTIKKPDRLLTVRPLTCIS